MNSCAYETPRKGSDFFSGASNSEAPFRYNNYAQPNMHPCSFSGRACLKKSPKVDHGGGACHIYIYIHLILKYIFNVYICIYGMYLDYRAENLNIGTNKGFTGINPGTPST